MKKILLSTLILGLTGLNAEAGSQLFIERCKNVHSLTTYARCDLKTDYGYGAYLCALNDAMIRCKSAYYTDCVEIGVSLKSVISNEFIGYKACEAKVTVRGWK